MCCKSTLGSILVFILFHFSTCIEIPPALYKKFECSKVSCEKPLYQGKQIIAYTRSPVGTFLEVYAEKGDSLLVKTARGDILSMRKQIVRRHEKSKSNIKDEESNQMNSNHVEISPTPSKTQHLGISTSSIQPSHMIENPGVLDHSSSGVEEYNEPGVEESEDFDISIESENDNDYNPSDTLFSSKTYTEKSLDQNLPLSGNLDNIGQNTQFQTQIPDVNNRSQEKIISTTKATLNSELPTGNLGVMNLTLENKGNDTSEKSAISDKENGTSAESVILDQEKAANSNQEKDSKSADNTTSNQENGEPATSDQGNGPKSAALGTSNQENSKPAISDQGNSPKLAALETSNPENSKPATSDIGNGPKLADPTTSNQENGETATSDQGNGPKLADPTTSNQENGEPATSDQASKSADQISNKENGTKSEKPATSDQGNSSKSADQKSNQENDTKLEKPVITKQNNTTEPFIDVSSAHSSNATDQGLEKQSTTNFNKEDGQTTEHAFNVSPTTDVDQTKGTPEFSNETQSSGPEANTSKSAENMGSTQGTPESKNHTNFTTQTLVTNVRSTNNIDQAQKIPAHSTNANFTEDMGNVKEKPSNNASSVKVDNKGEEMPLPPAIDTSKTDNQITDTSKLATNTETDLSTANISSIYNSSQENDTQAFQTSAKSEETETVKTHLEKLETKTTSAENKDQENGTLSDDPIIEKTVDINERIKHTHDQIYRPPYHVAQTEIQQRYGADQPTMGKYISEHSSAEKTDEKLPNLDSQIDGVTKATKTRDKNLPDPQQQKSSDPLRTHLPLEKKDNIDTQNEITKSVNSNNEQLSTVDSDKSYFTETYNNLNLDILSDYISSNEIFKDYSSSVIFLNTVLFLLLLLLLNCLSVRKCDNIIKGKLYMCEKKLLEHNAEAFKIQEMLEEQNENSEHFKQLQDENEVQKSNVTMLTKRINDLEENEIALKESLSEFKSKYETLEEVSSKKNIKKNYEKLMDQVKVQKNKLDELAASMEERAEVLRKEKENIESLLKVQAEEHNKVVNDYRMLLNNVELENKELREIIQTMSVDSDTSEKLLEAVKLQVQLSDMEKESQNLQHQLEGEREAHKLLEDHQRMTQKEVNDLRESCEIAIKEKADISNKLKYITDYFQQLEDKLKKEIADKDELINEKLGDDDSLAKALMNLRKENCVLNEENNILRVKYDSLKVELTDQKNEEKIAKTKLESEREQIWMDWRAAERKIESLNLDNKVLRSKLVALGSKSETSFRDMHTQTYDDPDKMLSPTSSLFMDHTSPVPQPAFFIPSYAIPPPPLSDDEMRQMYGSNRNYNENGYHTDEDHEHSYDHRLPPLGGTFSPPTLDNIPVPNIPPPLDNEELWKRQTWNSQDVSSNEDEPSTLHNSYSRRRTGDSVSSVSSSKRSFV